MSMLGEPRRPGFRARVSNWTTRHPFVALSIGIIVIGWLLIAEIVKIADARTTVAHDWTVGLVTGALAAAVLVTVMTMLVRRSRQTHKLGAFSVLILVSVVSVVFMFRLTFTNFRLTFAFLTTNWLDVAAMSYVAVFAAVILGLIGWTMRVYWRRRQSLRRGETETPGWLSSGST